MIEIPITLFAGVLLFNGMFLGIILLGTVMCGMSNKGRE